MSAYPTAAMETFWKYVIEKMKNSCKYPVTILAKENLDQIVREQPSISNFIEEDVKPVDEFKCPCAAKLEIVEKPIRPKCFMDFQVKEGVYLGRIVMVLYSDIVPVTVQNFMSICCKENDLTYKNCPIHRVDPGNYIETGDITKGNGKGGTSIYGKKFAEENHKLKHCRAGVLSTVRVGYKVNNSIFSITLTAMDNFDGNRVAFGKIIHGMKTLFRINDLGRKFGKPVAPIIIQNCGRFVEGKTLVKLKTFRYT